MRRGTLRWQTRLLVSEKTKFPFCFLPEAKIQMLARKKIP